MNKRVAVVVVLAVVLGGGYLAVTWAISTFFDKGEFLSSASSRGDMLSHFDGLTDHYATYERIWWKYEKGGRVEPVIFTVAVVSPSEGWEQMGQTSTSSEEYWQRAAGAFLLPKSAPGGAGWESRTNILATLDYFQKTVSHGRQTLPYDARSIYTIVWEKPGVSRLFRSGPGLEGVPIDEKVREVLSPRLRQLPQKSTDR